MTRSTYLFRMDSDEYEQLEALSTRYGGKRAALAAGLRALARLEKERDAETQAARSTILSRLDGVEARVDRLEQASVERPRGRTAKGR